MWSRLVFLLITAFFVTMNVLLWRSEFGHHNNMGRVPLETVWHKMVIAPDNSKLEIRHHGKKIGYGTWTPSVGEELATGKRMLEEPPPEGMIPDPSGYNIDFGGTVSIDNLTRVRFTFDLRLTTNHHWQEMSLHLMVRPSVWDVRASAAAGTVTFSSNDDTGHSEQVFKLADLEKPDKFLQQAGWPISPALIAALGLPRNPAQANSAVLGLQWEARNDWLQIASERMRVYRLQARLLDRFQIAVFISLEGEILRVELPDEIVLVNDQLSIL
jgi:hypothetical protein